MATDSGTTFYTIFPENPMGSLNHGDHYVLVPDVNSTHDVRLTIDSCGGDFPVLRWLDRSREFVALGDDFLVEGVATGLIWNATLNAFVIDGQAVNIHGFEWLIVEDSTTVGKGTARLLFINYGAGTVTCDLTNGRQFSTLMIHNGGDGGVAIRADSIGATAEIYRKGILITSDVALGAGETVQFACFEEDKYTLLIVSADSLPSGGVDTFLALTDTPNDYTDDASKVLRVNVAEDEVEFSPGLLDRTTQPTVIIEDTFTQAGPLLGGYSWGKRDNKSYAVYGGSTGINLGAHIQLFAEDAGAPSNDMDFRTGTTSQFKFDYSFKTWDFFDNKILGQNGFTINEQHWPVAPGNIGQVIVMTANNQLAYGGAGVGLFDTIIASASDEESALTVSAKLTTFRAPYPLSLAYVRASLTNAPAGSDLIVDVLLDGVSLFSTPIHIDPGETTSKTSATQAVLSTVLVPDDGELTIDVLQIGSVASGTGLKVAVTGVKGV